MTKGLSLCHIYKNGRADGTPIHSIPFSSPDLNGRVVWPGKPRVAGVLVKKDKKKEEEDGIPASRPVSLEADVVRFKNGTEDWIAFVGLYNHKPYEIFTGKVDEDALYFPKTIKKGNII